jgi:hypothetical protein
MPYLSDPELELNGDQLRCLAEYFEERYAHPIRAIIKDTWHWITRWRTPTIHSTLRRIADSIDPPLRDQDFFN